MALRDRKAEIWKAAEVRPWAAPARFILALINKNMSRASLQNYLQKNFKL